MGRGTGGNVRVFGLRLRRCAFAKSGAPPGGRGERNGRLKVHNDLKHRTRRQMRNASNDPEQVFLLFRRVRPTLTSVRRLPDL